MILKLLAKFRCMTRELHEAKSRIHKLYKIKSVIKSAHHPTSIAFHKCERLSTNGAVEISCGLTKTIHIEGLFCQIRFAMVVHVLRMFRTL